ncbi:MAG: tetratricopeptide repeat protein, partial [Promethearchaeota archaeon]
DKYNYFALINLGNMHEANLNREKAEDYYKKSILINPKDPDAWYNLGNLLGKMGKKEERLFCFIQAENLGFKELDSMIQDLLNQGIDPINPIRDKNEQK